MFWKLDEYMVFLNLLNCLLLGNLDVRERLGSWIAQIILMWKISKTKYSESNFNLYMSLYADSNPMAGVNSKL